jgi:hypothetical protein
MLSTVDMSVTIDKETYDKELVLNLWLWRSSATRLRTAAPGGYRL